ncbi:MAG TPA: hypothetical protein VFG88_08845 [Nocardioidaceae bacterium]|jgi:hypothetical protein|nr:hypothetical protein [Nocardioidaceae bacterium]
MSDYLSYTLAQQQISERVAGAARPRLPRSRRYTRRHSLAAGLHQLANRIDR